MEGGMEGGREERKVEGKEGEEEGRQAGRQLSYLSCFDITHNFSFVSTHDLCPRSKYILELIQSVVLCQYTYKVT